MRPRARCEVCGQGTAEGELFRMNVGELPALWCHAACYNDEKTDDEVEESHNND